MTDGSGPDDADGEPLAVFARPDLEPGMRRHGRTDGFWGRARRRHPVAVPAVFALPLATWLGLTWLLGRYAPGGGGPVPYVVTAYLFLFLRRRAVRAAEAADDAEGADLGRAPIDVRAVSVVRPSFGAGTPTGDTMSVVRFGFLLAFGGVGVAVAGAELLGSWRHPDPVPLWCGALALVGGAVLGELFVGTVRRRTRAFAGRDDLDPVPVRVVGLRTDDRLWVVEPLDGRPRIVVKLYSGDDDLVAGDVVHAWGDITLPPEPPHLAADDPRVVLTGPFGTLWSSKVLYDSTWPVAVR